MENGGGRGKGKDLYEVLGVDKECSPLELRNAYKKLALRWHPDRFTASGNSKFIEEAKKKFQAIQQAYSVLSDDNNRFLYDVGIYENDDDENGMGDFLNEMVDMMCQTKPNELFEDMFKADIDSMGSGYQATSSYSTTSAYFSREEASNSNNLHNSISPGLNLGRTRSESSSSLGSHFHKFCFGMKHQQSFKKKDVRRGAQEIAAFKSKEHRKVVQLAMTLASRNLYLMQTQSSKLPIWI